MLTRPGAVAIACGVGGTLAAPGMPGTRKAPKRGQGGGGGRGGGAGVGAGAGAGAGAGEAGAGGRVLSGSVTVPKMREALLLMRKILTKTTRGVKEIMARLPGLLASLLVFVRASSCDPCVVLGAVLTILALTRVPGVVMGLDWRHVEALLSAMCQVARNAEHKLPVRGCAADVIRRMLKRSTLGVLNDPRSMELCVLFVRGPGEPIASLGALLSDVVADGLRRQALTTLPSGMRVWTSLDPAAAPTLRALGALCYRAQVCSVDLVADHPSILPNTVGMLHMHTPCFAVQSAALWLLSAVAQTTSLKGSQRIVRAGMVEMFEGLLQASVARGPMRWDATAMAQAGAGAPADLVLEEACRVMVYLNSAPDDSKAPARAKVTALASDPKCTLLSDMLAVVTGFLEGEGLDATWLPEPGMLAGCAGPLECGDGRVVAPDDEELLSGGVRLRAPCKALHPATQKTALFCTVLLSCVAKGYGYSMVVREGLAQTMVNLCAFTCGVLQARVALSLMEPCEATGPPGADFALDVEVCRDMVHLVHRSVLHLCILANTACERHGSEPSLAYLGLPRAADASVRMPGSPEAELARRQATYVLRACLLRQGVCSVVVSVLSTYAVLFDNHTVPAGGAGGAGGWSPLQLMLIKDTLAPCISAVGAAVETALAMARFEVVVEEDGRDGDGDADDEDTDTDADARRNLVREHRGLAVMFMTAMCVAEVPRLLHELVDAWDYLLQSTPEGSGKRASADTTERGVVEDWARVRASACRLQEILHAVPAPSSFVLF